MQYYSALIINEVLVPATRMKGENMLSERSQTLMVTDYSTPFI